MGMTSGNSLVNSYSFSALWTVVSMANRAR